MRHHAETSATTIADLMLADLRLSHHTLVQLSMSSCSDLVIRCGEAAVLLFAAIDLLSEPVCPPRAACGSFPGQPSARPPVMELLPVLRASQEEARPVRGERHVRSGEGLRRHGAGAAGARARAQPGRRAAQGRGAAAARRSSRRATARRACAARMDAPD